VAVVTLVVPQIALASWWNPFSWRIFSRPAEVRVEQPHDVNFENKKPTTTATSTVKITQQKEVAKKENTNSVISPPKKQVVEIPQKQIVPGPQVAPKQEEPKTSIVTFQNGAVAEIDAKGNVIRWVKEAPIVVSAQSQPIQTYQPIGFQISSINVTPSITSARIEWQTDKPTESKIFLSGEGLSSKVYNSESGLSTRHSVLIDALGTATSYSYEIEAINQGVAVKKGGTFLTNINSPTEVRFDTLAWCSVQAKLSYAGVYCSSVSKDDKLTFTVEGFSPVVEIVTDNPTDKYHTYSLGVEPGTLQSNTEYNYTLMLERGNQFALVGGGFITQKQ